jgi:aspartokinase-like uncharacterized kinase
MNATAPRVVKIGGSLAGAGRGLAAIMDEISAAALDGGGVVVVPGGGLFADAVREAQRRLGFDDAAAHDMALLAMAQFGRLLADLPPRTAALCDGAADVATALRQRRGVPLLWQPDPRRDALDLERSWRVSADSLALWLAGRLGAERVILVKSCAAPASADLTSLATLGIIDAAYPELAGQAAQRLTTTLIYAGQRAALRRALAANS